MFFRTLMLKSAQRLGERKKCFKHLMVVPKASKSNIPTFLEIFYCWCILHCIPLSLPFIFLNHMRSALSKKKAKLPCGSVITLITRRRNAFMDMYSAAPPSIQGTYNSQLFQNLDFKLTSKGWIKVDDPDVDEDPEKGKTNERLDPPPSVKLDRKSLLVLPMVELPPLSLRALNRPRGP